MLFNQGLKDIINYQESESVRCSVMSDSATPRTVCSPPGSSVYGIL